MRGLECFVWGHGQSPGNLAPDIAIFFVNWMHLSHLVGVKEVFIPFREIPPRPPFFLRLFLLAMFLFIFTTVFYFWLEVQKVSEIMESYLSG